VEKYVLLLTANRVFI